MTLILDSSCPGKSTGYENPIIRELNFAKIRPDPFQRPISSFFSAAGENFEKFGRSLN